MNVFDKQDAFLAKMLEDYNNGSFKNSYVFKPYMDWKQGKGMNINQAQSWEMRDEAQSQLDDYYNCYPHAYESGADHMKMIVNNLEAKPNRSIVGENYEVGTYMMKYNEIMVKKI